MKTSTLRLLGYIMILFGFFFLVSGFASPEYLFMVIIGAILVAVGVIVYLFGVKWVKKKTSHKDKGFEELDDLIDHYKPR